MPIRANALVVMAKAPIPGSVKTRLMPFLSAAQAAALSRALLVDQLEHLCAFRSADLYLAFTPADARRLIRRLAPPRFEIFAQRGADLGPRMQEIFATLFAKGHNRIVLIGADVPPIPFSYFRRAFTHLQNTAPRAVLGPSLDGGYCLIGVNRVQPEVFVDMSWSHDRVFAQTLARLRDLDVPTLQLPQWFDIDTPADLNALAQDRMAAYRREMKNTMKTLAGLKLDQRTSQGMGFSADGRVTRSPAKKL